MRIPTKAIHVVLLLLTVSGCDFDERQPTDSRTSGLAGPYLGMEPPGDLPELFAPGIVADVMHEHSPPIFSPDGKEVFWSVVTNVNPDLQRWVIVHMEEDGDGWSAPELFFLNEGQQSHVHSISPDGMRLYFSRTQDGVLVSERGDSGWASPRGLPEGISREGEDGYAFDVQEANSGNLYFVSQISEGPRGWGIVSAELADGGFQPSEVLGPNINSGHEEETPYIDPEERFLLFASTRPGGFGDQDLYISHRLEDGSWGEAINLGSRINSKSGERYPRLSPDGRYLFFVSRRTDFADRDDFDRHRLSFSELKAISTGIMNGLANIYWVKADFLEGLHQSNVAGG